MHSGMQLEDYWGVGPKTAALLREAIDESTAIEAIESADSRPLVQAGVSRGRATRILRRAQDDDGMDILSTRDARQVYRDVVELAEAYAVTEHAADRIRILTPLTSRSAIDERLDETMAAVDTWDALTEETREAVLDAFAAYDRQSGKAAAVETAIALRNLDLTDGVFTPLVDLDSDALEDAAHALRALETDGSIADGADEALTHLNADLGTIEDLTADAGGLLDAIETEARDANTFRETLLRQITSETTLDPTLIRDAMPNEATDASMFVTETLRALAEDLREQIAEREAIVRTDLESTIERVDDDVTAAITAVDDIALQMSLARFALAFDMQRPTFVEDQPALAVRGACNLDLLAADETVQSITYAVGSHDGDIDAPTDDRVAVLTGANSGGKTTLLETLCQVALLAHMGLPVPADAAVVSLTDALVFHRRHASFNAGVLETTLRSVIPPLTDTGQTLMLVDEFEAITEPGRAADLLHGLVTLTVEREALGVFVTHLAEDLEPLPDSARVDGIFAEGLTADLDLKVDYQPRFTTLGQSTPEFIVSRLVAQANDASERYGFETLARAVGQEVVQGTLADAQWTDARAQSPSPSSSPESGTE